MSDATSRSQQVPALIVRGDAVEQRPDSVVGEEPLQIRVCGPGVEPADVAITMRTPGDEAELAVGFLVSEGILRPADAPTATVSFGDPARIAQPHDEVLVRSTGPVDLAAVRERHFVATASCGICGRATIDELAARVESMTGGPTIARSTVESLPDRMREAQAVFDDTGGIHAAALFSADGVLIDLREDVGRHNALDKLIGARAMAGELPLADSVLLLSGRISFELVQKAAVAGIPVICAVSAPSDLAVSTAQRLGMTLVGFLRGRGFNVYAGPERIDLDA